MKSFLSFTKKYLARYWWWYVLGFLCIWGTQSLMLSIIGLTGAAIDVVATEQADANTIMPFVYKIMLFAPLIVLIRTASRLLIFTPGRLAEYHIRNDYYSCLLFLQRDFYSKHETGDLVSRCSNDISFIRGAFGFGFLQVAAVSITLVLAFQKMMEIESSLTLYIAIPMMISFAIIQVSIKYMFSYWRKANSQIGELSNLCLASFKGVSSIQNYHAEPAIEERFYLSNLSYLRTQKTITKTRSFVIPIVQLVGNLCLLLVLRFGGTSVIEGELSLGDVTQFLLLVNMVMPPLLSLGWMLNVFNRALPAIERLEEILHTEPNLPEPVAGAMDRLGSQPLHFEAKALSVSFKKEEDTQGFILKNVSFELPLGKVLGICGPLGAGKSALLETMVRLNTLDKGMIYLNGVDAYELSLQDYRSFVSFTPQKALLFSNSLRNNLLTGLVDAGKDPQQDEKRIMEALDIAGFDLDPKQFPDGLETQVGEKGVMLSGGQRQRIGLARALLKDSQVYILDDVLSAVDHETEKRIIKNLQTYAKGKTLVIASHRISAIQWTDEIIVLEEGEVTARGTHDQLINQAGFYREIYQYQAEHQDENHE